MTKYSLSDASLLDRLIPSAWRRGRIIWRPFDNAGWRVNCTDSALIIGGTAYGGMALISWFALASKLTAKDVHCPCSAISDEITVGVRSGTLTLTDPVGKSWLYAGPVYRRGRLCNAIRVRRYSHDQT